MRQQEQINPAILIWARESAGLGIEEAARRLALGDSDKHLGEQKLLELERGQRFPSRTQLSKFAKTYRRPLVAFYMNVPPKRATCGEDFRTTGNEISLRDNALLDALLRDIKARQQMIRDILEDLEEALPKDFVSSSTMSEGPAVVAKRITKALNLPARRLDWGSGPDDFFKRMRTEAENLGVFVLLVGDLGSHHSAIAEDVFRGFAIADAIAPFIVINDHDARTARSFTLIHELTHIFIGRGGVSGIPDSAKPHTESGLIEQFCNEVASLVLLPETFADQKPAELSRGGRDHAIQYVQSVAMKWMVSEPLVAFRLRNLGWISSALYRDLSSSYADRWKSFKVEMKTANQLKDGGPDYYVLKQSRLGDALISVVHRSVRESKLTDTRAAKVLGVKPSSVETLLRRYEKSPASFKSGMKR